MMYTFLFFALLLLNVALAGAGFSKRFRRHSTSPEETKICISAAIQCGTEHLGHYNPDDDLDYIRGVLANYTFLEQIAADLENAVECLETVTSRSFCGFMTEWSIPARFIFDFINSPGTINKLVAVSASPCLDDYQLLRNSELALEDCVMNFERAVYSDNTDVCDRLSQMLQCLETSGTRTCGQALGALINAAARQIFSRSSTGTEFLAWFTTNWMVDITSCRRQLNMAHSNIKKRWSFLSKFSP